MPIRILRHIRGFTLVEVLVALVIFAIGLLGLASIHMLQLRNNQSAYFRSAATQLGYDIADRVRANPQGALNGNYNNPAVCNPIPNCMTNACTSQQMACFDIFQWNATVAAQLPSGSGVVCIDGDSPNDGIPGNPACSGNGAYVVKIWWLDDRSGTNNVNLPVGTNCDGTQNNTGTRCLVMSFSP